MTNRRQTGRIVNRTGLAELFGVAMPTIDHWIRNGCPVEKRGGKGREYEFNTAAVATWRELKARDEAAGNVTASEQELKRRRLAAMTGREELAFAREKADVAPVAQFESAMVKAFAEVRANMRTIASRVPRMIVGEKDEARIRHVLEEEVDRALEALADSQLLSADDLEDEDDDGDDTG
ncbi:terminase small subunit [Pararhodobacter zhoushanensis]|uniref:terminase small subunit n=1 Tax=Pararhodobacter zhoushanensis TaxID=2479545 RepID=UPI000F8C4A22|nr:terminase small subunit [Pararhodobacter zhoushanensis]